MVSCHFKLIYSKAEIILIKSTTKKSPIALSKLVLLLFKYSISCQCLIVFFKSHFDLFHEFVHLSVHVVHHHHHHVMPLAQISLTLSRHFSLSFITFGRSSGLHPISSHSCCMYVQAGHPAFAWPYGEGSIGVHH